MSDISDIPVDRIDINDSEMGESVVTLGTSTWALLQRLGEIQVTPASQVTKTYIGYQRW